MAELKSILVVCVDRDDDLGRKAGVQGPILGRKNNINAAAKLGLADPGDTDMNAVFAAVKKFDEIRGQFENVEIVTLTGHGKTSFQSDHVINEQLDSVLDKFPADGVVLVTDGAEDDQVIPLIQSRVRIVSKENVVVKQAQGVESAYYTIREALKDPAIGSVVFGIPGAVLLLYAVLYFFNYQAIFFQVIAFIIGSYLILKGSGLERGILKHVYGLAKSMSLQRTSLPFYVGMVFIFAFGLLAAYNYYALEAPQGLDPALKVAEVVSILTMFSAISLLSYFMGQSIDAVHLKKAYRLRDYFMNGVVVVLVWFIVESGKNVFVGESDLNIFLGSVFLSFIFAYLAYRVSTVLDVRRKITKLLIGLPVYSTDGTWIGKVENVGEDKNSIEFRELKTKKNRVLQKQQFTLREGRILVLPGS